MKITSHKVHIYPRADMALDDDPFSPCLQHDDDHQIEELEVSSVYISNALAKTLQQVLQRHPIRRLILRMCEVWPDTLLAILQQCHGVQELTLHRVTKWNAECMHVLTLLPHLKALSIHYKKPQHCHCFSVLLGQLDKIQNLESLRLDGSPLDQDQDLQALVKSLEKGAWKNLQVLSFKSCVLSDQGVARIVHALSRKGRFPSLKRLDLSINCCYEQGMEALAMWLEASDCPLERLELTCQLPRPMELCVRPLTRALCSNTSLKCLRLSGNALRDCTLLGDALKVNTGLEVLDWCGNALDAKGLEAVSRALEENQTLQSLNLKSNQFDSLNGLTMSGNDTLRDLSHTCPRLTPQAQQIAFWCRLNAAGRSLLRHNPRQVGVWPLVLERSRDDVEALYFLIRNAPVLWTRQHTTNNNDR